LGKRARRRLADPSAEYSRSKTTDSAASGSVQAQLLEPPPPPWGSFPLTEISVAIGIVLLVAGFVIGGRGGTVILVTGLVIGSVAGFEQALREHRSGYKAHSAVLAGIPAAIAVGVLALAGVAPVLFAPVAVGVALAAWLPLRASFAKRG